MADRYSTESRLQRLNKRIKRLGPDQDARREQLTKRRGALQRKVGMEQLSEPDTVLAGRNMNFAARQLEKLVSRPAIDAQRNLIEQLTQSTKYDTGKLESMGGRLGNQVNALQGKMDEYGREAYTNATTAADNLNNRLRDNTAAAMDRTNQLQSQALGQQISALQGQNVAPNSSGTAQIMGQFAQAQQQGAANSAASWQNLGATMGAANVANTQAGTTAAKNTLGNRAIEIQRNIASRVADRMFQGSQEKSEAQSKLATLKGLRGAELVNQLMKLRGTEREYMSEKQKNALERLAIATQAQGDKADRAIDQYEAETNRIEALDDGSSSGSSGGDGAGDDVTLNKQEWQQYRDAADQHLGGGEVGNWRKFFDAVAKVEGVNWTPTERRKFAAKYKKYYNNK